MAYTIPFGKHKGTAIDAVPANWLEWAAENLDNSDVKSEARKELARRRGGDGPATGHGRPPAKSARAADGDRLTRAQQIITVGAGILILAGWPQTDEVKRWLLDLIAGAGPDDVPF